MKFERSNMRLAFYAPSPNLLPEELYDKLERPPAPFELDETGYSVSGLYVIFVTDELPTNEQLKRLETYLQGIEL